MTALDDALNSSAPLYAPPELLVGWKEVTDAEVDGVENLDEMSDMLTGKYVVGQSYDDALPDPVTMTTSADASGTLTADLVGREGLVYDTWQVPSSASGSSAAGTVITTTVPNGKWGQYMLMAIAIPSVTAVLDQGPYEGTPFAWKFLARQAGVGVTLWFYTKRYYTGLNANPPVFYSSIPVGTCTWICNGLGSYDPSGRELTWRINAMVPSAVTVGATGFTQASVSSTSRRAVIVGVWASLGTATWTVGSAGDTIWGQATSTNSNIVMSRAGMYSSPTTRNFIQATRSAGSSDVPMMVFAFEPYERPRMTPTQFWSPYNPDSPLYGFDRDTANVELDFNTVTTAGIQPTPLFVGQMNDVGVKSGSAVELSGVSRARINLNRSVALPLVFGRREGLTIDYLVAWILARGDRFIGPAPGYQARYWAPMYGSVHAALDSPKGYNYAIYWDDSGGPYGVRYPQSVPGPFHLGMFACQTTHYTQEIVLNPMDLYAQTVADLVPPATVDNYVPSQYLLDQFSYNNPYGRISFWLRGDPVDPAAVSVGAGDNYLFYYLLEAKNAAGSTIGRVWLTMSTSDRALSFQMGNAISGYTSFVWPSGFTLPTDGNWHFYSFAWSWYDGGVQGLCDGSLSGTSNGYAADTVDTTGWFDTDAQLWASGGKVNNNVRSHVPLADVIIEAGPDAYYNGFGDVWPQYPWPSQTTQARPVGSEVEIVSAGSAPVNAWDTVADLARNSMAMYRANETDDFEFLPPAYFGESGQLNAETVVDTDVNAQDLAVQTDPSKSRNVVTVNFQDTKVDESFSQALALTAATEIPRGVSQFTFTLDMQIAEIHGASAPYDPWWTLTNLTSAQITAGTQPYGVHFMTVNTKADGSGTVASATSLTAKILSYTDTTVTLQFTNKMSSSGWLANNYQGDNQLPFMRILGYVVRSADGYVTERDAGSVGTRRERSLEVDMDWITDRPTAQAFASAMVTQLARPRGEITVVVQGDPRRVPGKMITLADSQSTQAQGTWRILAIEHNSDGAQYTQTLQLVNVGPVGLWDIGLWDESIWSE